MNNPVITFASLQSLWPDLVVLLGAFLTLALDIPLRGDKAKNTVALVSVLSLVAAGVVLLSMPATASAFPGILVTGKAVNLAKLLLLLIGIFTIALSRGSATKLGLIHAEYYALLLFAVFGMMVFTSCSSLIVAFLALETFSLAMYVLAGFDRKSKPNREAALKYFLMGAFAAAFFLFGIAIYYGSTGSVTLETLPALLKELGPDSPRLKLVYASLALLLVGLGFKVGLAPFHLWAPDTYEGAPTPVTAFLSAGAKVAGFAMLIQLASFFPFGSPAVLGMLGVLAVLTMTLANLGALKQQGIKRLLAYSSVAHSGYALVGLAGGSVASTGAVLSYVLVYAVMNFSAFALLLMLERASDKPVTFAEIQGLGFERPLFGFCMAVTMFSMAGIPPTAGFIAKLNVFKAAMDGGQSWLLVLAVLNSVVSAAYYLKVLVALYMAPKSQASVRPEFNGLTAVVVGLCAALMLLWGLLPQSLLAVTTF